MVFMLEDESVTMYMDLADYILRRLTAARQFLEDKNQIRTVLMGLPIQPAMTRDLVCDLAQRHHEAVAILVFR